MKKFDAEAYEKRKKECLERCFQAFMDNGLENTGLQLLCKYCGFKTNQALYHYFESKDKIIAESIEHTLMNFEREFVKKAPRSREELKVFLVRFPHRAQKKYGEHFRFIYQVYTSPKYKKEGYEYFDGIPKRYDRFIRHIAKNLDVSFERIQPICYIYINAFLQYVLFANEEYLSVSVDAVHKMLLDAFEKEDREKTLN